MTERGALGLAAVGHLLLLAALSVGLARAWEVAPDLADVTPVEFVEVGAVTTVREAPAPPMPAAPRDVGIPVPSPMEPDLPEPVARPPEPEPVVPADRMVDTAAQDAIAERPAPPPPKPRAEPRPAPRRDFDPGAMAALIDKALPEGPRQPPAPNVSREGRTNPTAPVSAIQMATLQQAIRAQIAPCWNPPVGGADVSEMTAVLRIRMNRDGSVAGTPEFVSQTGATAGNQAYARTFVESARRAVLRCAPLSLPADLYPHWREFELNFDPRLMT